MKSMAGAALKIRLVRCPKCSSLLSESTQVPVYRCGGCNAILRSKYYTPPSENPHNCSLTSSESRFFVDQDGKKRSLGEASKIESGSISNSHIEALMEEAEPKLAPLKQKKEGTKSCCLQTSFPIEEKPSSVQSFFSTQPSNCSINQSNRCLCDITELLAKVDEIRERLNELLSRTENSPEIKPTPNGIPLCRRCFHDAPPPPPSPQFTRQICCFYFQEADHRSRVRDGELRPVPVKCHCLPAVKAAPFVICSSCHSLLQTPSDFLVWNSRLHKLRCGACSQVLMFSVHEQAPAVIGTPPLEAETPPTESSPSTRVEPVENGKKLMSSLSLHKLMGYTSAQELLHQSHDMVEEEE